MGTQTQQNQISLNYYFRSVNLKAFSDVGPFVMGWKLNKFPFTRNIIPFGWVEWKNPFVYTVKHTVDSIPGKSISGSSHRCCNYDY